MEESAKQFGVRAIYTTGLAKTLGRMSLDEFVFVDIIAPYIKYPESLDALDEMALKPLELHGVAQFQGLSFVLVFNRNSNSFIKEI